MKRGVSLLLSAVIMVLGVVSAKSQEVNFPKAASKKRGAIMAIVPNGKAIVRESDALAHDTKQSNADKRMEDKGMVRILTDLGILPEGATSEEGFISDPKGISTSLGRIIIKQSQRKEGESLKSSITRTLNLYDAVAMHAALREDKFESYSFE